jgi:hypothetical protein
MELSQNTQNIDDMLIFSIFFLDTLKTLITNLEEPFPLDLDLQASR